MNAIDIIQSGKGKIVDVRSEGEFAMGHVAGSVNIPLPEVQHRLDEFKAMKEPVLLVCASGNRSGIATMILQGQGIEAYNAGGWADFDYQLSALKAS